jgi:hypothetical protein
MDDNSEGIYFINFQYAVLYFLDEFDKFKTLFEHGDSDNNEGKLIFDVIY